VRPPGGRAARRQPAAADRGDKPGAAWHHRGVTVRRPVPGRRCRRAPVRRPGGGGQPGFTLDAGNRPLVTGIVRRLDGLPLAIELAAARLRTLPLAEISRRLADRFRLLTGGSRTALPRHRTLRAVVEWSWELLTPGERLLAERFSVFPAAATPAAASAVCAGRGSAVGELAAADADELLSSLVDKSLLQPLGGGTRLRMLETIREYGAEKVTARGEAGELRRRHAAHYSALMREAAPRLLTRDQLSWLTALRADRDNLLAALRYWCEVGDAGNALSLAVSLAVATLLGNDPDMALLPGHNPDMAGWIGEALAVPEEADADHRRGVSRCDQRRQPGRGGPSGRGLPGPGRAAGCP
jgi:hypothetical protein